MNISSLTSLLSTADALHQLNWSMLKDVIALAKSFRDRQLLWIMLWLSLLFKWLWSKEFKGIRYLWDWPTSSVSLVSSRINRYRIFVTLKQAYKRRTTACLRLLATCFAIKPLYKEEHEECCFFFLSEGKCRYLNYPVSVCCNINRKETHSVKILYFFLTSLKIQSWLQRSYGMSPGNISMASSLSC